MTTRQREYWERRMIEREESILRYYRSRPLEHQDGSFCMNAFRQGYELAKREAKKAEKTLVAELAEDRILLAQSRHREALLERAFDETKAELLEAKTAGKK